MNWPVLQLRGLVSVRTSTTNAEMFVSWMSLFLKFALTYPIECKWISLDSSFSGGSEYFYCWVYRRHPWHFKLEFCNNRLVQWSSIHEPILCLIFPVSDLSIAEIRFSYFMQKHSVFFPLLDRASPPNVIGHYTQVVWADTYLVGCATAYYKSTAVRKSFTTK
jgi:hypothetical protein